MRIKFLEILAVKLVAIFLLSLCGCGVKGKPLPLEAAPPIGIGIEKETTKEDLDAEEDSLSEGPSKKNKDAK